MILNNVKSPVHFRLWKNNTRVHASIGFPQTGYQQKEVASSSQSQYKLNSDAALKEHHQLCSMALRDHVGQITDGIAQNGSCSFPLAGENRAETAADMLAKAIQYQSIIFKSNSEILVKAINATFHPCFKPQEISRSIKLLFQNRFTEFKFVHCLAKLAFAYCIPCN